MGQFSSSRRALVRLGVAGVGAWVAGCAVVPQPAKPRVVVVGGGWGGLGAARTLAEGGQVAVTLIEPNDAFMSCPLSVHYVAGFTAASDYQRSYANVDRAGIRRVRARVTEIDRAGSVVVAGGERHPYDFLVLSPGVEYIEEAVQGYAAAREQLPVGFRAFEQQAVRRQVDAFLERGGEFVITVPKPPYRCPPAPYERAFLIAEQMKRRGTKGKIVVVDANPNPMPPPIAAPIVNAMKSVYSREIEYVTNTEVSAVDIGRRVLVTPTGDVRFTAANMVLPMRAPALIRQAGLGERWAAVRLPSFQSQADEKIYIVGDAQGTPLPKSGHVAFGAGKQVAHDIERRVAGQPAPAASGAVTLPAGICWAAVTHNEAIMINVAASVEPGQAPKLSFQVDPKHSLASGQGAQQWGESMWNQMLG
ncbi:FAD-dependent oxidoreductase [Azohydromonas sediminis]|uniref:FAD-dependent oxidoreductase n=1 Tax=Azohydromonas sediminis TaxID=2259674 RepID=UPI0013C306A5|nr:FAD/NAD(P)-binding oxidoreductase [Azohydromonas sediminis]